MNIPTTNICTRCKQPRRIEQVKQKEQLNHVDLNEERKEGTSQSC